MCICVASGHETTPPAPGSDPPAEATGAETSRGGRLLQRIRAQIHPPPTSSKPLDPSSSSADNALAAFARDLANRNREEHEAAEKADKEARQRLRLLGLDLAGGKEKSPFPTFRTPDLFGSIRPPRSNEPPVGHGGLQRSDSSGSRRTWAPPEPLDAILPAPDAQEGVAQDDMNPIRGAQEDASPNHGSFFFKWLESGFLSLSLSRFSSSPY